MYGQFIRFLEKYKKKTIKITDVKIGKIEIIR